jgi:hypothetical protein
MRTKHKVNYRDLDSDDPFEESSSCDEEDDIPLAQYLRPSATKPSGSTSKEYRPPTEKKSALKRPANEWTYNINETSRTGRPISFAKAYFQLESVSKEEKDKFLKQCKDQVKGNLTHAEFKRSLTGFLVNRMAILVRDKPELEPLLDAKRKEHAQQNQLPNPCTWAQSQNAITHCNGRPRGKHKKKTKAVGGSGAVVYIVDSKDEDTPMSKRHKVDDVSSQKIEVPKATTAPVASDDYAAAGPGPSKPMIRRLSLIVKNHQELKNSDSKPMIRRPSMFTKNLERIKSSTSKAGAAALVAPKTPKYTGPTREQNRERLRKLLQQGKIDKQLFKMLNTDVYIKRTSDGGMSGELVAPGIKNPEKKKDK